MATVAPSGEGRPKILVFSTNNISDPGIDLAGSQHMNYSPSVKVISIPCSGGINPNWVLHALEAGFDGVFIAADGGDCAYLPDCTTRTARIAERAQGMLKESGAGPAAGEDGGDLLGLLRTVRVAHAAVHRGIEQTVKAETLWITTSSSSAAASREWSPA